PRALRTFHLCSTTLERELGVRPSAATQAAYQALLPRTSVVSASPQVNSPFVGRDPERARLATAWRDACAGRGRFCLVSGEAGVGKTRLTEEFRAWCARRGVAAAEARCYAAEGPLPYAAVTAWLRADAVRPRLVGLDQVRRVDLARLLPDLLLELGGPEPPPPLPEDEQRARIFAATAAALDLVGERLVLLVDDLQYADRETCRLIHYLLRAERPARLLVLATVRTGQPASPALAELLAALGEADQLVRVELSPFGVSETAALAERLTGARPTTEDAHRLHQQTGGNPFFLVESVRAGWRPGSDRVPLSPRVQAVLETRLAGLAAPTRELAEAAALLGRAFDVDLLAAVLARTPPGSGPRPPPRAAADEDALVAGLDELWRAGVIRERGSSAFGDTYDFTHEALREVASSTVSPVRRPLLHRRIADALEHRAGAGREELSAEVAFHLAGAGKLDQAARRYHRAAEAAQLLHAHAEAIRLLEQALTLVVRLPTGQDRDALELTLRTALLSPLVSEQGYASAAVAEDQQRAVHLTRVLGAEASPPLLRSLAMTALTEDRFGAASDYGRRLRAAAGSDQSGVLAVEADVLMGFAAFWRADFAATREHLEAAVAGYRPERSRAHLIGYGQDPKVVALARLGNTRWFLGDPTGAREARAEALAWAEVVGHPYSRAAALLFAALLALDGDEETELRRAAAALQQTGVEALPVRLIERALHGHLRVLDADPAAGLALIKESIERARAGAAAPGLAAILARIRLAACAAAGDPGAVAAAADDLLTTGTAAAVWAPEAERMRAAGLARTR
ncbi:MAG: ATP-binding protein, partial [Actinomycetes bacterium]